MSGLEEHQASGSCAADDARVTPSRRMSRTPERGVGTRVTERCSDHHNRRRTGERGAPPGLADGCAVTPQRGGLCTLRYRRRAHGERSVAHARRRAAPGRQHGRDRGARRRGRLDRGVASLRGPTRAGSIRDRSRRAGVATRFRVVSVLPGRSRALDAVSRTSGSSGDQPREGRGPRPSRDGRGAAATPSPEVRRPAPFRSSARRGRGLSQPQWYPSPGLFTIGAFTSPRKGSAAQWTTRELSHGAKVVLGARSPFWSSRSSTGFSRPTPGLSREHVERHRMSSPAFCDRAPRVAGGAIGEHQCRHRRHAVDDRLRHRRSFS